MNPLLRVLSNWVARLLRTIDLPLLGALLLLMASGLLTLYSASNGSLRMVMGQGSRFVIGLGLMWLLSRIAPPRLRAASPYVYLATILPLLAVLVLGRGHHGNLWINLGVFYFQPSELIKLSLPMMLAWYLHNSVLPPNLRTIAISGAIAAVPILLILKQPDFGTSMLITCGAVFTMFLAGLSWWWFIGAFTSVAVAAPAAWFWFLKPYQKDRILIFLNPDADKLGAGWNITQSKIAIGSGGWFGQGWMHGTQSHLNYLPEHTTDFLFSVLGEEFGWLGVALMFLAYLVVIGRCLWIAMEARDSYSRLLAGTLGLALFAYVMVNGGMISGMLPVVGVPMPLLSYGGTSAVVLLAGMGLVMSVRAHSPRRT
ncbi:MAG: rod shape-determining protein RodA [Proteobacteria bacterium]|nr:rod shape-determining protein RodA [Pseudomonadota bacterium]